MEYQMGRLMENMRYIQWDMLLVQDLDLWEVLLIEVHMDKFLPRLRVKVWKICFMKNKELREVLLVAYQSGM